MDIEPFLIASTLAAVLGQRLVRVICGKCRTPYEPDDEVLERIALTRADVGGRPFHYGKGCRACSETGYHGRKGIFEYLPVTDAIRELISARSPTLVLHDKAAEQGMRTMREDGVRNVLDGYTTVEEVLKCT